MPCCVGRLGVAGVIGAGVICAAGAAVGLTGVLGSSFIGIRDGAICAACAESDAIVCVA